jgi:diguanylate cyclase (GGDEF)-like protein/PAS domain S-box-containing protein
MHFVVTRRIGKLMLAVDSFRNRQEDVSSGISGRDEIGQLGAAFDEMVRTQVQYSMKAHKLSQAVEQSAASVIIADRRGTIEFVNPAFTSITGYTQDEAMGKSANMLSAGETKPEVYKDMWDTIEAGGTWRGEMLNRRKNGELYWDAVVISPVRNEKGEITHFVAVQEDITARKEVEGKLLLNMHILNSISEGVAVTDIEQKFCYVNPAFTAITGYSAEEVIGKNPRLLSSGLMERTFYGRMWGDIGERGHWQGEIIDRRKSGESYPEWLSISTLKDERGRISRYVSVFTDISERKEAERRVAHMAQHDFLTGLPNRMLLLDRLAQAIRHASREKHKIALIFLDLDRFKNINDTLGHPIGDKLLIEVSSRIARVSRAGDTVSRLGGDEFVVMLPGLETVDDISGIADKLLESVSGPCLIDGKEIDITTSIGISVFPDDGSDGEALLRQADSAMYHAKQDGRNNYRFFTAEMNRRALERMDIEHKLRHAMSRKELQLYYQPQIDRLSGNIIGAEALLRWDNAAKGLVLPGEFISIAEETGLIIPIGEWALREACRQNAEWRKMGLPEIFVSVNLSAVQFRQKNLAGLIRNILEESGLEPAGLELEITESAVMNNTEAAILMLYEIKALGVKLAMDDFGTGYSSLIYLKRLPIDRLKIDQSFVRHMADDADDAVIVGTIINMARNLGLKNIAEGVETEEQMELLSLYGCDGMQGYHFGKPMPADEFIAHFRKRAQL